MCKVDGCTTKIKCRGMCKKHYEQWLAETPASEKAWKKTAYPDDETLVQWARAGGSQSKLAARLGVRRESLRDYLNRRQVLKSRVEEATYRRLLTPAEIDANMRLARSRWREANPDRVREINRRWGKNQDAAKRHRWNTYNRRRRSELLVDPPDALTVEFVDLVKQDPCGYCAGLGGEADHVVVVAAGGLDHWSNYAGACRSCNASKSDDGLLQFMLRKALEEDRKVAA